MSAPRRVALVLALGAVSSACALLAGIEEPQLRAEYGPDADPSASGDGAPRGDGGGGLLGTGRACTKTIGPSDDIEANIGPAGSVLCLASGTYHQTITASGRGTADGPIVIQAAPGATPVLDGKNEIPTVDWGALVTMSGSYVVVDGLEIANSTGRCVNITGTHNQLSNNKIHHCHYDGVLASGDDSVVDSNVVSSTGGGIAAGRDLDDGITRRAVLRRNVTFDNREHGLVSFEAEGTLLEGNVSYNNSKFNLLVGDTPNATIRNNLVYNASPPDGTGGHFTIADMNPSAPRSSNIVATNNLLYGASLCETCWSDVNGLRDIDAHHNTIVAGELLVKPEYGTNIRESANCVLPPSKVPGLGAVVPGALTPERFATASCPPGTGADTSKF